MLLPETGRFLLFPAPVCVQRCPSRAGRDPAEPRGGGSLGREGVRPQGLRSRGCLPVWDLGPRARQGRCPWSPGGQACPELAGLTESTTFLGSTQALKGEAARPGISSRRQVQPPSGLGDGQVASCRPPCDILGQPHGPGFPVAKWPLSGREGTSPGAPPVSACLSTALVGVGGVAGSGADGLSFCGCPLSPSCPRYSYRSPAAREDGHSSSRGPAWGPPWGGCGPGRWPGWAG